jgi:hypothetical protein
MMHTQSLDLFGDVAINHSDITIYLKHIGLHNSANPRREYYAEHWNIANKIKLSKLDGSFAKLITAGTNDEAQADAPLKLYSTKYKSDIETAPVCPTYNHKCTDRNCSIYQKNLRRERNNRYRAKQKAKAEKAERVAKKAAKMAALIDMGVKF